MLILLSNKASQIDVPAGAEISMPCGQYSEWGNILMMGMRKPMKIEEGFKPFLTNRWQRLKRGNIFTCQRGPDTVVHPFSCKSFSTHGQRLRGSLYSCRIAMSPNVS